MSTVEEALQRSVVAAHKRAHVQPIAGVVAELRELLSPKLVAYISGVGETRATRQWAEGLRAPHPETQTRLRTALQAALIISDAYDTATAQAGMQGIDPALDDRAPATVLRDSVGDADRQAVVVSAQRFVIQ